VCLNCARRMVSPKKFGTKYSSLSRYLLRRAQFTDRAVLKFAQIEGIIGDNLPFGAVRDVEWWANSRASAQGRAWTDVGWKVESIDLNKRTVTFVRVAESKVTIEEKREKRVSKAFAKKTLMFKRPKRRLPPSKTRLARAQARLRNVQREKAAAQQFKGKVKPRPAHEKRLFKPEAKPSESAA